MGNFCGVASASNAYLSPWNCLQILWRFGSADPNRQGPNTSVYFCKHLFYSRDGNRIFMGYRYHFRPDPGKAFRKIDSFAGNRPDLLRGQLHFSQLSGHGSDFGIVHGCGCPFCHYYSGHYSVLENKQPHGWNRWSMRICKFSNRSNQQPKSFVALNWNSCRGGCSGQQPTISTGSLTHANGRWIFSWPYD